MPPHIFMIPLKGVALAPLAGSPSVTASYIVLGRCSLCFSFDAQRFLGVTHMVNKSHSFFNTQQ